MVSQIFLLQVVLICNLFYWSALAGSSGVDADGKLRVTIVFLSQSNSYDARFATMASDHIKTEAEKIKDQLTVKVLISHEEWDDRSGVWTVLPILEDLYDEYKGGDWFFFIEDRTDVHVSNLVKSLKGYNSSEELFLGRALRDQHPSIIHHYAFVEDPSSFAYPDFSSGFLISEALMKTLVVRIGAAQMASDFSIDPKHELAMFIWNEGKGTSLGHHPGLCSPDEGQLARCFSFYSADLPMCGGNLASDDKLLVMVKTCEKFHKTRLPIVKKLWADAVPNIEFCSEVEDKSIPTVKVVSANTENGHCGKLLNILKRAHDRVLAGRVKWIVIVDDDTLMNVDRLKMLLKCYKDTEPIALGERYGYGVRGGNGGYDYITGGGGMVLNAACITELMKTGPACSHDNDPDDMMLGIWLRGAGISVTHSGLFHQAQPISYSMEYIRYQESISFHKLDPQDPKIIYNEWLNNVEPPVSETQDLPTDPHTEL